MKLAVRPLPALPLRLPRRVLALAALLACQAAPAQVTLFNEPPSADEVLQALALPAIAAGAPKVPRSRGIRFGHAAGRSAAGGEGGEMAADGPAAAPAAASAPFAPAVATAPSAPPEVVAVARHGPAVAMRLEFDSGSARLSRSSLPFLVALAGALKRDPGLHLTVEGHTDDKGDRSGNLVLSWDRAMSVYHVLVGKYGVDPARLLPQGKGMTEPLDVAHPDDPANRRVQFRVTG